MAAHTCMYGSIIYGTYVLVCAFGQAGRKRPIILLLLGGLKVTWDLRRRSASRLANYNAYGRRRLDSVAFSRVEGKRRSRPQAH